MAEAQKKDDTSPYLRFILASATALRANDRAPQTLSEWTAWNRELRRRLLAAWGGFPSEHAPLNPRHLGELKRDGYRVEKIVFQTRPGVLMTANAYVPDGGGKRPAVLCVHGHWKGAKQDPVVQRRCIGLAKHGFFVLCVDAFGAGERALGKALGEYHGEMVGATLLPVGLPLSGLQVYENMRAVDYLQSRPEVDGAKIGITGASGGGNQTMYAGAMDERFGCVVPVCSVGTYKSYLGAACCMCEVVPGAIAFTEEAGLLSLVAPRGLMIINATQDAFQFSVGEARKSVAAAKPVFELYGKPDNIAHAIFESPHDYNREMREAMYGWMTLHLKGEGTGAPLPESEMEVEDPETLRCFPGDSRPDDFITIPRFAAAEGRRILAHRKTPDRVDLWKQVAEAMRYNLTQRVFGGFPIRTPLGMKAEVSEGPGQRPLTFAPEPGLSLTATVSSPENATERIAIVLDLDGAAQAAKHDWFATLRADGWRLVTCDLRGTGALAQKGDAIGRAPDHNTAEWGMFIGRPLLGQWVWDVMRLLDALQDDGQQLRAGVTLVGIGPASVVALCAGICDSRIRQLILSSGLASYLTESPYVNQRLGILAPRIVADVGDIPHLLALFAPRKVVIDGPVQGNGEACSAKSSAESFSYPRQIYGLLGAERDLLIEESKQAEVLRFLNG